MIFNGYSIGNTAPICVAMIVTVSPISNQSNVNKSNASHKSSKMEYNKSIIIIFNGYWQCYANLLAMTVMFNLLHVIIMRMHSSKDFADGYFRMRLGNSVFAINFIS